jgi:enoyl-CoA hydratase/carnithine racemase
LARSCEQGGGHLFALLLFPRPDPVDLAYGRINSTWTLPNQVGWPIAKELLFSARVVEAEEAYRIGLLNQLVPRERQRRQGGGGVPRLH